MVARSFVGRGRELDTLSQLLGRSRLTTLAGPAGIGKTRLAHELADRVGNRYPDGVQWVALARVTDPSRVPTAVVRSFELWPRPGQELSSLVADHIARRRILLVLDNCEHLLAACGRIASSLLGSCPNLSLLITSQAPLDVPGERVWVVPALALPLADADPRQIASAEAVQLFAARAAAAHSSFSMTGRVASAVAEICRRLDGNPLAIELAAARVTVIAPAEIAERLENRFAVLTDGRGLLLDRHQSLQGALDWSYGLLTPEEQRLLRMVSVFEGGCTLAALEGVAGTGATGEVDVPTLVRGLVARSLMVTDATGAQPRYRLLETIRAYAADRLDSAGEAETAWSRHAAWCLNLAERAEPHLTGSEQLAWLGVLEADQENLAATLDWAMATGNGELALRLSGALVMFWRVRGHYREGRRWLDAALAMTPDGPAPRRAKALWGAGFLAHMLDDDQAALASLEQSLGLARAAGDERGAARALLVLGNLSNQTDPDRALAELEESARLAERSGDRWCLAHAEALSGWAHVVLGNLEVGRRLLDHSLWVARSAGDHQSPCIALHVLGRLLHTRAQPVEADEFAREGLAQARLLRDPYAISAALDLLGDVRVALGDPDGGRALYEEGVTVGRSAQVADVSSQLNGLGILAFGAGDWVAARDHFRDAAREWGGEGNQDSQLGLGIVAVAAWDLPAARRHFEDAMAKAQAVRASYAVAAARDGLGYVARRTGNLDLACEHHLAALELRTRNTTNVSESLEALAVVAATARKFSAAARLIGASKALRRAHGYWGRFLPSHRIEIREVVGALGAARYDTLIAEGARWSPAQAIAYARQSVESRASPGTGWSSLTEAEGTAASMAARGLTNPEIADRLGVSFHTVAHHLTRVFAKLGITSRTDLAREVARRGTPTIAGLTDVPSRLGS